VAGFIKIPQVTRKTVLESKRPWPVMTFDPENLYRSSHSHDE